jgi:UDP:flavonoid glycosyltransferase YjiC (YdhE family)
MKFIVVTYGTEGDTRPLSVLCRALMDAGHDIRLLADGATLGSAVALGVPTTALAGDIKAMVQEANASAGGVGSLATAFKRIANANTAAWLRDIVDAGRGCDAILVSGLAAFAGLSAAEYLGVSAIGLGLIPITPTAEFASPFLPPRLLPRVLNRWSHRFVNSLVWRVFSEATNAARVSICGLPPRRKVFADHPMLYGVSPSLLPQPADWPANARVCGQWVNATSDWRAPQELVDFLDAGAPPIYVGFGSMVGFDSKKLLDMIIAAVDGRRALIYPGWSGMGTAVLPDNFFVIGETPHAWLFPRTSLVIHHGGSGTSHSATRAGVPSVVIPFAGDQPFWGDRLYRAGVADRPISAKRMSTSALAKSIEFAEGARACAASLRQRMAAEDGCAVAIEAIEKFVRMR